MNENIIGKAVEDIRTIKDVIEQTGKSFLSFGKIFFLWGVLFCFSSVFGVLMSIYPKEFSKIFIEQYPFLGYILPLPVIVLAAILIYFSISEKIPLNGLEKKIMSVWICIFLINVIYNLIPQQFTFFDPSSNSGIQYSIVSWKISYSSPISIFTFSIGLYVISLFTYYKQTKWSALLYLLIGILSLTNDSLREALTIVIWPATFLYLGIYLYIIKLRSEKNGYKPNT